MSDYQPPLRDIDFVLDAIVDLPAVAALDGYQHADPETVSGVLAEAGRFFAEVIAPTNRPGDLQGSTLEDGSIRTPDGFKEAYTKFVEAGWAGVHFPEEWGGGGFPYTVGIALQEMFKSANMAFSLCPLLTHAGIEALLAHGSETEKAAYLEKLVSGEWAGTMCLTEPHAGSDVGALSSRATRQEDGSYRISGQKIFITWADQDMTENILHLVLARTPDAAPGTKGISLFLVPKLLPETGERNSYEIVSIEHKLGIHASPTCVVSFEDAVGYLIGEEQQGMRYMFTMMNTARIGVGIEGLAIGERAYQHALAYARDRRQGRAIGATESSPIIEHPDVRRMLLTMKAYNEAMRCVLYTAARTWDMTQRADDAEAREAAAERVALMTPVAKAWCTDLGVEVASLGVQVHGGMGYVEETGAAQFFRDSRIAPIYEGTNGIQAIDLVTRKLPLSDGNAVRSLLAEMRASLPELDEFEEAAGTRRAMESAIDTLEQATAWLGERLLAGAFNDALAGATPYLGMFGTVLGGWMMARSELAARRALETSGDDDFLWDKVATASFYCTQLLPQSEGLLAAVTAGSDALAQFES